MASIVYEDVITALGPGADRLWQGVLSNQTAIRPFNRFATANFQTHNAAFIGHLDSAKNDSLAWQMLWPILLPVKSMVKKDTILFLATTTGEIDFLERAVKGRGNYKTSSPLVLLERVKKLLKIKEGRLISAACASSSSALAQAAAAIESKGTTSAIVVAVDSISQFVFSGFSSLFALDPEKAKPFDQNRKGLSVGEAAGVMVLSANPQQGLYQIKGWGLSCDANHITGPSRDGAGLSLAIARALNMAKIKPGQIVSVCAHGTGTVYNDAMEMKAFKKVFLKPLPVYSIKGAIGHTMAAAGLTQAIVMGKSLQAQIVPPSSNLQTVDPEALGWVQNKSVNKKGNFGLVVNSGFGGINCALVLNN